MKERNGQRLFDPQPIMRGLVRRRMSVDDLARELEVDPRTVNKALDGGAVTLSVLAKICKAVEVTGIRFLTE